MNRRNAIEVITYEFPQYRDILFARGYLVTDNANVQEDQYPFFGIWKSEIIGKYRVLIHPQQTHYVYSINDTCFLLIGHAYNPFSMIHDESKLLVDCAKAYFSSDANIFQVVNEWTGIFALLIFDRDLQIVQDCSGIKSVYYGNINGVSYISSHAQLIADLCDLEMDPFIKKLISNRMYKVGNRYLPGDMSPFTQVKHLSANLYLTVSQMGDFRKVRFFPSRSHGMVIDKDDCNNTIQTIYEILHKNIELAARKWDNRYISLSGGMDSRTTLACANGLYEKFKYFSFTSKDTEFIDAAMAHKMCEKIGLAHEIIPIPMSNVEVLDYDVLHKLIDHNDAYVRFLNDSEIRKQITLYKENRIGVELKSWISETVRVFMDRKYGLTHPAILSPRHFSIFQTRFMGSPFLLHKCDSKYADYIRSIGLEKPIFDYEHTDLYYWEFRMGSWGMMVATSLDMCHTITFPWNNRLMLEKFLSLPRNERKRDNIHRQIIALANPALSVEEVISNKYYSERRIWLEKLYYFYRTLLISRR